MKYFRLFQTHAEHEQEKGELEKLEMYLSYCKNTDEVTLFYNKKSKYEVGDYLLSSGEVIKNADYTNQKVIGVCVIPDNFISKMGINSKARFCALTESTAEYKTSDTEDIELSMFNKIGCVGESVAESGLGNWSASNILTHNAVDLSFISGQANHFNKTVKNKYDPGTYWYFNTRTHHIASPYLYTNGEYVFNEGIYNGCVNGIVSALSDMDGKANTTAIENSDHKAVIFCAGYSTNGTSAGDWYLPAIGELAFIMPRFDIINNAISKVDGTSFNTTGTYWSSTQGSTLDSGISRAYTIYTRNGAIQSNNKNNNLRVRPFFRLG